MDENILIKYLARQCTGEELHKLQLWLEEDPSHAKQLFELESIWEIKELSYHSTPEMIENAYENVWNCIQNKKANNRSFIIRKIYSVAKYAAVLIIFFSSFFWLFNKAGTEDHSLLTNKVEVPVGQTSIVHLSDGSKIWLNAGSVLSYPAAFTGKNRTVELEGEGYFEVVSDPSSPFIVKGHSMQVKVLGTKFNFKTYKDEMTSVTLAEGSVQVNVDHKELFLSPDQQISYSHEQGIIFTQNIDANLICGWMSGEFIFARESLKNIVKVLERRFNINIQLEDESLAEEIFTCRTRADVQLYQVLDLLKDTRKIDYEIKENRVLITKMEGL